MKHARTFLAGLALLGSATLGLAGCAASAAGDATPATNYSSGGVCTDTAPGSCEGHWGGGFSDHWWRQDEFHHVSDERRFDHGGMYGDG
jgi:hypothetical protein